MNYFILINGVIKILDILHDILCPFFRDSQKNSEKEQILEKLKSLQEQLSKIKSGQNK